MMSLAEDLRESTDSLDTILKRHNTNLMLVLGATSDPAISDARRLGFIKDENKDPFNKFEDMWLNRLDLTLEEISQEVGRSVDCVAKWSKKLNKKHNTTRSELKTNQHNDCLENIYPAFKDLYLHYLNLNMDNIRSRLNISRDVSSKLIKQVRDETGLMRKQGRSDAKLKVVDGLSSEKCYEVFRDLYLNHLNLTIRDIKTMLDLQTGDYTVFMNRVKEETGLKRYYNRSIHQTALTSTRRGE
jgi:CTP-dependent riboflavin kinase